MALHQCQNIKGSSPECAKCILYKHDVCAEFVKILNSYGNKLWDLAPLTLQDILAEAATAVITSADPAKFRTKAIFCGWAREIFNNKKNDYFRRKYRVDDKQQEISTIEEYGYLPHNQTESGFDAQGTVDRLIDLGKTDQLSAYEKRALEFFYNYYNAVKHAGPEATEAEIAAEMGMKPNTLTIYKNRYRDVVKHLIEKNRMV